MSDEAIFVDTDILVYAYDAEAGEKHRVAASVLLELWAARSGRLSIQVLQELYVTLTRKLRKPLNATAAREVVQTYASWPVFQPRVEDVIAASELEARHRLSFWDALVVVAAQGAGAAVLLSEDLNDGQRFGRLVVRNPFTSGS